MSQDAEGDFVFEYENDDAWDPSDYRSRRSQSLTERFVPMDRRALDKLNLQMTPEEYFSLVRDLGVPFAAWNAVARDFLLNMLQAKYIDLVWDEGAIMSVTGALHVVNLFAGITRGNQACNMFTGDTCIPFHLRQRVNLRTNANRPNDVFIIIIGQWLQGGVPTNGALTLTYPADSDILQSSSTATQELVSHINYNSIKYFKVKAKLMVDLNAYSTAGTVYDLAVLLIDLNLSWCAPVVFNRAISGSTNSTPLRGMMVAGYMSMSGGANEISAIVGNQIGYFNLP